MLTRVWRPPWPVDVRRTLSPHRRGPRDPAFRFAGNGAIWRTSYTPDGPGTLRVVVQDGEIEACAFGEGAQWLLDGVPDLLGAADDPESLTALHAVVREGQERQAGMRIGRTNRVFEALVPAVLEQKVVGAEAWRAWAYLLRKFGEPAPGAPADLYMRVPPPPAVWARIPSWDWHKAGAEAVRARTIITAARSASQLERTLLAGGTTPRTPRENAERRLRSLPGIGVWTAAEIRQRALGDPDAVSVGDYHLPGLVGWALVGRKVDDAGMLELLEPYAGQRYRVTRLLELSGKHPPRRGPRMSVRDYRSF